MECIKTITSCRLEVRVTFRRAKVSYFMKGETSLKTGLLKWYRKIASDSIHILHYVTYGHLVPGM